MDPNMIDGDETFYGDSVHYPSFGFEEDKQMYPFRAYTHNRRTGRQKTPYMPLIVLKNYDHGEQEIYYEKHLAKAVCAAMYIMPQLQIRLCCSAHNQN